MTEEQLDLMRDRIKFGIEPQKSAFDELKKDSRALKSFRPEPLTFIDSGPNSRSKTQSRVVFIWTFPLTGSTVFKWARRTSPISILMTSLWWTIGCVTNRTRIAWAGGLKAGKHKIVLTVNNGNYDRYNLYGEYPSMHNLFEVLWKIPGATSPVPIPPSALFKP